MIGVNTPSTPLVHFKRGDYVYVTGQGEGYVLGDVRTMLTSELRYVVEMKTPGAPAILIVAPDVVNLRRS